RDTPGLSFGAQERKMGWHSQPTSQVLFDDCRVPVANRLGEEGQGFRIAMQALDGGRVNIAACSLGAARAALERALDYVRERRQFGQRIADFQATRFRLADMATELEAARLLVWRAAERLDRGAADAPAACAMAKRFATDVCYRVVDDALQLHGGYGYIREYGIERLLRDLRVHRILEGTNEIMRVIIARHLLDRA
ncbi:MAG TPA: acyl-CoA dehydrogenase, partial [Rhodospirillales bacterium]|nr:acyl-CoA dehydrogenase [Rhodospirillales bacterium]